MSRIDWLDGLSENDARDELLRCCGSKKWAENMLKSRPFRDQGSLMKLADEVFASLAREDWLEAFAAHPRIGNQRDVHAQVGKAQQWAKGEQAGANDVHEDTRAQLADANAKYENRFGYIYIVCATGKSAEEMLSLCRARLAHAPADELRVAAEEQRKITQLRLQKLLLPVSEVSP